ncbi:MAG: ribonuclease P protein component [Ruminococcaceae bacterium]|nr:ribonuclease P protein component [Oscillospiraceae bacterium]
MKHTEPLRMNYEFARVYKRGRFLVSSLVVLHYFRRKGPAGPNRLGVTVSKKVSGSVRRNRIKRLLRESYRLQESELASGYDIILTGRHDDPPPTFAQIDQQVGKLLRRAGIKNNPPAPTSTDS